MSMRSARWSEPPPFQSANAATTALPNTAHRQNVHVGRSRASHAAASAVASGQQTDDDCPVRGRDALHRPCREQREPDDHAADEDREPRCAGAAGPRRACPSQNRGRERGGNHRPAETDKHRIEAGDGGTRRRQCQAETSDTDQTKQQAESSFIGRRRDTRSLRAGCELRRRLLRGPVKTERYLIVHNRLFDERLLAPTGGLRLFAFPRAVVGKVDSGAETTLGFKRTFNRFRRAGDRVSLLSGWCG